MVEAAENVVEGEFPDIGLFGFLEDFELEFRSSKVVTYCYSVLIDG